MGKDDRNESDPKGDNEENMVEENEPVVTTYEPILADWGEPDMEECATGGWVALTDYLDLLDEYNDLVDEINRLRGNQ